MTGNYNVLAFLTVRQLFRIKGEATGCWTRKDMPSSTSISFVVIYAQPCKHVYNFRILESKIPQKANLISFDQPRNCRFSCSDYRSRTNTLGSFQFWDHARKWHRSLSTRKHQRGFWRGNDHLDEGIRVSDLRLVIPLVTWCPIRGSWNA